MADQYYQAPVQGYSWAGQPPQTGDAFSTAGTSMIQDYAIMRQRQNMEMYQRALTPPQYRSQAEQSQIAFSQASNFGMMGHGPTMMQNQASNNGASGAAAFALTAGAFMATLPLYNVGSGISKFGFGLMGYTDASMAGASMLGRGAFAVARGAVGMGIGGLIAAPVTELVERGVERRRWANDISRDLDEYSGRWTQGRGFGAINNNALGREMMEEMTTRRPGEFFRAEDQLKINKMGLASGLLRGNDIGEYKKNFEDLKKNAKDIVQLLNTTIEGGMSVMKEMQGAGFRTPGMMSRQIQQAAGYGMVSGMGTQNMLGIGMAGAQNAIGTGWSPAAASNMYMTNATNLTLAAQNNGQIQRDVVGLGGIANATAGVSNTAMNIMASGMGLRMMTAVMDPTSHLVNRDLLEKVSQGKMGAEEIISRSSRYGTSGELGGAANRATAGRDVMRAAGKMDSFDQMDIIRDSYMAWAKTHANGIMDEQTGFAYIRQFAPNDMTASLFTSQMMGSNGRARDEMIRQSESSALRGANYQYRNQYQVALGDLMMGVGNGFDAAGSGLVNGVVNMARTSGRIVGSIPGAIYNGLKGISVAQAFLPDFVGSSAESVASLNYGDAAVNPADITAYMASPNKPKLPQSKAISAAAQKLFDAAAKNNSYAATVQALEQGETTALPTGNKSGASNWFGTATVATGLGITGLNNTDISGVHAVFRELLAKNNIKDADGNPLLISKRDIIASGYTAEENQLALDVISGRAKAYSKGYLPSISGVGNRILGLIPSAVGDQQPVSIEEAKTVAESYKNAQSNIQKQIVENRVMAGESNPAILGALDRIMAADPKTMTPAHVKTLLGADIKKFMSGTYASTFGVGLAYKNPEVIFSKFSQFQKGVENQTDFATDVASDMEARNQQLEYSMNQIYKKSDTFKRTGHLSDDESKKRDELQKDVNANAKIMSERLGQGTSSSAVASSTPPNIMNYWNNNWRAAGQ